VNNSTTDQPLTDDELDRLADFLDAIGPPALNLESLDGYFAALICGPDVVLPSDYLPEIWGDDYSFASNEQAAGIVGLLMRHWNTIASALQRTLEVPDVYVPVLLEAEDGIAHGNDWAQGFMRGIRARPASWLELIESDEHGGPLLPIMRSAHTSGLPSTSGSAPPLRSRARARSAPRGLRAWSPSSLPESAVACDSAAHARASNARRAYG
jgi:uncharacterized protein